MVAPFKRRHPHLTIKSVAGGLLRALDMAKPDPRGAEIEVSDYFAGLESYRQAHAAMIGDIWQKYRLDDYMRKETQTRIIKKVVHYLMRDDILSQSDRAELQCLIHALGLKASVAMEICKSAGQEIYYDRLREAKADGVITEDERRRLNAIKRIFGLQAEVPAAGVDYPTACSRLSDDLKKSLEGNRQALGKFLDFLGKVSDANGAVIHLEEYSLFKDDLEGWMAQMEDYMDELVDISRNDQEAWENLKDLESHLNGTVDEINRSDLKSRADRASSWFSMTEGEIHDLNHRSWDARKNANRAKVLGMGFNPAGSPKQKSLVYDIIAEQCLASPFWEFSHAKSLISSPNEDDLVYVRFIEWLKLRPCSWWIGKFQDTDLEAVYERFVGGGFK